ncbi:MAG: 4-phosphoerythronate dehydrogenase [Bacteroidales bacterium]|nr:4-phosphoerythronate dehydrogenase [Bacteroidales bacterium]
MEKIGKLVADCDIPYIHQEILEAHFDVLYKKGDAIDAADVSDAVALIVRTRTKCNEALLKGSGVKFIATATIGTDHIDMEWCRNSGIHVVSAPGCNSNAVVEYVLTAIHTLKPECFNGAVLGIVGMGNIGSRLYKQAAGNGLIPIGNDPYKNMSGLVGIETLLERSDIVTLHIPLWECNRDFASDYFFKKIKKGAIFINASRGAVCDEEALLHHRDRLSHLVLDVWKGEPNINPETLAAADIATPHIAGYSLEGKRNATSAVFKGIANFFSIFALGEFAAKFDKNTISTPFAPGKYDILADSNALKANPASFEQLRNNYKYR